MGDGDLTALSPLDNFFENEFRSLLDFETLNMEVPSEFAVDSVKFTVNYRKDFIDTDTIEFVVDVKFINGIYHVDSLDLDKLVFDEGVYLFIQPFLRLKDCSQGPSGEKPRIHLNALIRGRDGFEFAVFPFINTPLEFINPRLGRDIIIDYPTTVLQSGGMVIDASERQVCKVIQMELSEKVNVLQWSARLSVDDQASYQLTEKGGLQLQEISSGEYIGLDVERGVYEFQYCFISNTCSQDTLLVDMNWACELDNEGETCYDTNFVFEVRKYEAELELDLMANVKNTELCDTTEWWYIDVFNGDIGSAYDVSLTFSLPDGLTLFESGLQYKYPANAGWLEMPLPLQITPLEYTWDISQILDTDESQLPGVNDFPDNRVQIRMKLITSCELEQRSIVNFFVTGQNPCGSMTNLIRKSTAPIEIKDVMNSFQTDVTINLEHDDCEENIQFHIEASSNLNTSGGELIEVSLPIELDYIDGSMFNPLNISLQTPGYRQEFGRTILTFISESIVAADEIISFSFQVANWQALQCIEDYASVEFKSKRTAFCKSLGMPCETNIINGRNEELLLKDVLSVQIDSVQHLDTTGASLLKIWVNGNADTLNSAILINLHQDVNMNRTLDSNDIFIRSDSFLFNDTTKSRPHCIPLEKSNLCSWIIEVEGPCYCNSDTLYFEAGKNETTEVWDTICAGDSVYIGKAGLLPGSFSWHTSEVICDTCSHQIILGMNDSDTINNRIFRLEMTTPEGCNETYVYNVMTYPTEGPYHDTIEICPGDSVQLVTQKTADWVGSDIDDLQGKMIKVAPQVQGNYQASYLDDNQCFVEHNFFVITHPTGSFVMDSVITIMKGDSIQLIIDPKPDSVKWSSSNGLSCISCPDPWAKPDSTTIYEVTIFDTSGCPITLRVNILVVPPPCDESSIFLPNVFSPNGDNINDVWRLRSHVVDVVEIIVYDRWGEQVFYTSNPDFQWDGSHEGEFLKPDVFAYYAQFICLNGETIVLKGNLTLMR